MTHRCIKPQCSAECYECNQAINEDDDAAMLVCDLLDSWAINGFEQPLEDGENQLVDRARAWLAARHVAHAQNEAACGGSALTAVLGANERERDAAWISLVMNAAAEIEDAANCLRDSDAKRVAHSAAKHYRDAANALWIAAVPNDPVSGSDAAGGRSA